MLQCISFHCDLVVQCFFFYGVLGELVYKVALVSVDSDLVGKLGRPQLKDNSHYVQLLSYPFIGVAVHCHPSPRLLLVGRAATTQTGQLCSQKLPVRISVHPTGQNVLHQVDKNGISRINKSTDLVLFAFR